MSSPDILFKGIPRGHTRGYTREVLESMSVAKLIVPCTGSFSLVEVARSAGVPADRIFCGDISLYSTGIGRAIDGNDWKLNLIESDHPLCDFLKSRMDGPLQKATAILFAIRYLQYQTAKKSAYHESFQRELLFNGDDYFVKLTEGISEMAASYRGVTYLAQDMWITMQQYGDQENDVILINPPRYTAGYDKMFAGLDSIFEWDAPQASQFTEADYPRMMDALAEKPALSLMYYATQGEDPSPLWGGPWRAVFADRPGNSKRAAINWIISNRNVVKPKAARSRIEQGKAKYRLFSGDITKETELGFLPLDKLTADYYKDLFIHKLPGGLSEVYGGIFLDGMLLAVCGVFLQRLYLSDGEERRVDLTFCFTVPNEKYGRLHKLSLMSVCSSWLWETYLSDQNGLIHGRPEQIHTTMLTPHPENKTARGILKLINREKQADGTFKLSYMGVVADRSAKETLLQWLTKFGQADQ